MPSTRLLAAGFGPGGGFFPAAFLFLLLSACASVSPLDGRPLAVADVPENVRPAWRGFPVGPGEGELSCLAFFSGRVSSPRLEFHALRMYLFGPCLRVVVAGGGKCEDGGVLSTKVSSFVRGGGLLAGINALPFDPVSGREGEPRTNVGVVISDGRTLSPPHGRFDALVFFADGSAAVKPQPDLGRAEGIANAVGGFRRILEAYEPVPAVLGSLPRHPRSAAGVSSCGRFLYLLVVDGRRLGSVGSTEAETALLLRALGAADGINFDGGGSSALVLRFPDGEVRPANVPVHGQVPGRERAVAGVLGIARNDPPEGLARPGCMCETVFHAYKTPGGFHKTGGVTYRED